jgi:hypothetical protein
MVIDYNFITSRKEIISNVIIPQIFSYEEIQKNIRKMGK